MAVGNPGILRSEYKFNVGDVLNNLKIIKQTKITKQEVKRKNTYKAYEYECLVCGYIGCKVESIFKTGCGCPCCDKKIVVEHINSIVANEETHWMVDYFQGGWNEAKLYTRASEKKVVFKCPDCGSLKDKLMRIADLNKRHSIGCSCQDGISYPEKIGRSLFHLIDDECVYQYKPDWSNGKLYDFYLPKTKTIIELHGDQHYKPRGFMVNSFDKNNDILKERTALENGILNYFQVDCRESTFEWIKTNIEKIDLFDFSNIDWAEIFQNAEKNIVKDMCDYKSKNQMATTKELCELFNISSFAVLTYLKKGEQLGWCKNNQKELPSIKNNTCKKEVFVFSCGKQLAKYESATECAERSFSDFGVKFNTTSISQVCSGKRKTHKGYVFKHSK